MSAILDWIGARVVANNAAAHALGALTIMAIVAAPLAIVHVAGAHWLGAVAAAMFYYGREKRDDEVKRVIPVREFWRGWLPWQWSADGQRDFYAPLAACVAAGIAVSIARAL